MSSASPARRKVDPMALLHGLGPLLGLAMLCATMTALSDRFLTVDNLINVFRQSSVNALLSLGQLVVIITAGIDLSAGSILGLSCVMSALLLKWGVPPAVSLAGALALGAGLGAVNGLLFTKLRLPHPFIPTLGMMNVARGFALVISGGFPISELPSAFRFWGAGSVAGVPVPLLVVAVSCGLIHIFLSRTTAGRDIYAIGGNALAARLSGVPVDARLILVYALSGLMAGAGAIVLAGRMNSGFPLAGTGAELDAIAAVIIGGASFFGGAGSVGGTLLGAMIMGVLRNGLNLMNVNAYWQTIVIGGVIVIAVWIDAARKRAVEKSSK